MFVKNFDIQPRFYDRRDPVSGETQTLARKPHSRQSSPNLKRFQRCMRSNLEGHTYRSGDARQNAQAVRQAVAQTAAQCSRGGGSRREA